MLVFLLKYINWMNSYYKTFETIFNIVHQDTSPITYQCRPREIILRQFQDWSVIQQHLKLLVKEGLVLIKQMDTLIILLLFLVFKKLSLLI